MSEKKDIEQEAVDKAVDEIREVLKRLDFPTAFNAMAVTSANIIVDGSLYLIKDRPDANFAMGLLSQSSCFEFIDFLLEIFNARLEDLRKNNFSEDQIK